MVTEYPLPSPQAVPSHIAAGPDGNLWFTEYAEHGRNAIGRITPDGVVTEYRVPTWASGADGIAAGGAVLWFTEHLGDIVGRVTTSGAISEFPVPTPNSFPDGITLGPDRAVWFVELGAGNVGRLGP